MKDICAIKSIYFQHKVLRKTQKRCIFLTSTDFKAFLYVIPLINLRNSKIYQQICILAVFFVSQLFWYILCFVLQTSLFKGSKLAQSKERRPNLVNLPVRCSRKYRVLTDTSSLVYNIIIKWLFATNAFSRRHQWFDHHERCTTEKP